MTLVQTEPKKIYLGNNELKAVYLGDTKVRPAGPAYPTESIIYKMKADSNGKLYVPTGGYNHSGNVGPSYSWKVSVDGGTETTYSGTGGASAAKELSGYTSGNTYTIMIKPTTEDYGWALAYGWSGMSSAIRGALVEVVYDGSYMGYGTSATATGAYFRYYQYNGCTSLIAAPDEYLPDTVTTIGNNFRTRQFENCTSLTTTSEECLPSTVTSIGTYFRRNQYSSCTALIEIKGWKDLTIGNSTSYRASQFYSCTSNKTIKVLSDVGYAAQSNTLSNTYVTQVQVPSAYLNNFINSTKYPRSSITDSKFVGY